MYLRKISLCSEDLEGRDGDGREGGSRGRGHIYMLTADLHCCMTETYSCREIPWTEEPGGLQSMGSLRVRHN